MTILQAIRAADAVAHNDIEEQTKVLWLSWLEGQLVAEVLNCHEGTECSFEGFDEQTDPEQTELLAKPPYDEFYVDYLVMRIYYLIQDIERYNNAALVYAESLRRWKNEINRRYPPKGVSALRF